MMMAPMLSYERGAPYYDRGPPYIRDHLQEYLKVPQPREPLQDYFRRQAHEPLQDYLKVPHALESYQDYVRPSVRVSVRRGSRRSIAGLEDTYDGAASVYQVRQRPAASSPAIGFSSPIRRSRSSVGHMSRPMHLLRVRETRDALSTSPFGRELGYYNRENQEGPPANWSTSLRRGPSYYRKDAPEGVKASWSANSVPEVLQRGGAIPFRFCPTLGACQIPRASIRISRKNAISSPGKVDRVYKGPSPGGRVAGPPNLQKAHSTDAPQHIPQHHHHNHNNHHHNDNNHVRRPQVMSQSSVLGNTGRRGSGHNQTTDDSNTGRRDRNGRWGGANNTNSQCYELSQDLADMRLEMLEKRYGGEVARRAAVTIQKAYRHYMMAKKFRTITANAKAQEKRWSLSRRFTVDVPEWDTNGQTNNQHDYLHNTEQIIRSEFDSLQRNLKNTVYGEGRHRPQRSQSVRDTPRGTNITNTNNNNNTTLNSNEFDLDTSQGLTSVTDSSLYCPSSTTSSDSPLTPTSTPTPPGGQNHKRNDSADFHHNDSQSYVSSKPLNFSSDESGFGSVEGSVVGRSSVCRRSAAGSGHKGKKVPPSVPQRSSSIKSNESGSGSSLENSVTRQQCQPPSLTPPSSTPSSLTSEGCYSERGSLRRSGDNGSLSSVQSSGSDSSLSQSASDRATPVSQHDTTDNADYHPTSPVWKRKNQVPEVVRKRQYRVGLNLFNKKPEKGITYLINRGFLENSPQAVAKFLLTRKGLSKQMIGEYLGNLQNNFNMAVLECFAQEIDLSGMQVDVALRKFQTYYRMPGEAQKIERLMQVFAQRYCQCNRDIVAKLRDPETIFVMAFAIIMLNTDLHTSSMKAESRMKPADFIKNLRGIDDGYDIEKEMLEGMYQRIKTQEFKTGHDHVTQVLKVQQTMVGKKPNLALPHRRLVCYCRLYEIPDISKKERVGVHQREVFLFNDLLVVTKIFSKKKNSVTYTFRQSFPLAGLAVSTKETAHYPYLMEIRQRVDNKLLMTFNARNEHDRSKFCEDLKESVCEMDEMESLRIEGELERQKASLRASRPSSTAENRDSGVADMEILTTNEKNSTLKPDSTLKRSALSNSLLDIHEAEGVLGGRGLRRGSVGSLDSGMSVSFQSTSVGTDASTSLPVTSRPIASSASHGDLTSLQQQQQRRPMTTQSSFLGQLFRTRRNSRTELATPPTGVEV